MRGKPVSELSVGQMLDGLFAITRDFDMQTQPHLLLLQKTMVMVEGVATMLNPRINMCGRLGALRQRMDPRRARPRSGACRRSARTRAKTLALIPDIIRRLDAQLPKKGAAPPAPPLPEIPLMWTRANAAAGGVMR